MVDDFDRLGIRWKLEWIRVRDLVLDAESYQRGINQAHLDYLIRTFDADGLGVIYVNRRAANAERLAGLPVVVEGQHRVLLLRERGLDHRAIACAVAEGLAIERERKLFLLFNRGHLPLDAYHAFQTRVADREVDATAIADACARVGLELIPSGRMPGVRQTGALTELQRLDRRGVLAPVLEMLNAAWGEQPGAFREGYLKLVTRLLEDHTPNVLIPVLRALPPQELERQVVDYLRGPRATQADYIRVVERALGDMSSG